MKEENQYNYFYYLNNIVSSINIPDISIFPDKSGKLI